MDALNEVVSKTKYKFDGEDVATAIGILRAIQQPDFLFMLHFLKRVLDILEPANRLLQSREMSYITAMPLINILIEELKKMQSEQVFDELQNKAAEFLAENVTSQTPTTPGRARKPSVLLADYEVASSTGQRNKDRNKKSFFEVLKVMVDEMNRRFTENSTILNAISSSNQMDLNTLKPLEALGITLPAEHFMKSAKAYIDKKRGEDNMHDETILTILEPVKAAYEDVFKLYSLIYTFGCSTAVNESSFSALSRIDIVKRSSMNTKRLCDLTFLAYNKQVLNQTRDEDIMARFNNKNRRLLF